MPKWIADDLASTTPKVIETLTAGLGPSGVAEPTILAAWEGADREGASYNGGTLKGLVLMRFEGESALRPLPALADLAANMSDGAERALVVDYGRTVPPTPRLSAALRPLAVLAGLGAAALARGGGPLLSGPGSTLLALRIGMTGR